MTGVHILLCRDVSKQGKPCITRHLPIGGFICADEAQHMGEHVLLLQRVGLNLGNEKLAIKGAHGTKEAPGLNPGGEGK